MKKFMLTAMALVATCVATNAQALGETFEFSGYNYYISSTNPKEVTLNGTTYTSDFVLAIPATVQHKLESYNVTAVTGFKENANITGVSGGSNLKKIHEEAFSNCSKLESVYLNAEITDWGENIFSHSAVKKVSINAPISEGAQYMFYYCKDLTEVTLGDRVTTIPNDGFIGCSALSNLKLGNNITSIGANAFSYCSALKEFDYPSALKSIGDQAFSSTGLTSITIPASITFGTAVFISSSLTDVVFEEGVTAIPESICQGCPLTSVSLPLSTKTIGNKAFRYCTSLREILIPANVTSIGEEAFNYCDALSRVIAVPMTPPTITDNVFSTTTYQNAILQINPEAETAYKEETGWRNFMTDVTTGVDHITPDNNAAPLYFNLDGQRVNNPSNGIFIEIRGTKTRKVIL